LGLVSREVYDRFCKKRDAVEELFASLKGTKLKPKPGVQDRLKELGTAPIKTSTSLEQLLKRPEILFEHLSVFDAELSKTEVQVAEEIETRIKYAGYIDRQERQVEKLKRMENVRLPDSMDYQAIHGLTTEVREKLTRVRPISLGQASRISGVTPAALMALQVHLKRSGQKH
ncbi:MAG: tRNA uridine-5-carboxymethylaminomethyl(34) synthesis enzyme MnmG, partial [Deltaproteobacteria bacterium]|nr:tRNA uridine-5-carboxymethylaminomethyl(34) synthesis enzyme MnmG [Deltaproteobacteria bacterium]